MSELVGHYVAYLEPNEGKQQGIIALTCANGHGLRLYFRDPRDTLPPNTFNTATKTGTAHQPFSMYQHYLDLLRNERPIRVIFTTTVSPPVFVVRTGVEFPGEGE